MRASNACSCDNKGGPTVVEHRRAVPPNLSERNPVTMTNPTRPFPAATIVLRLDVQNTTATIRDLAALVRAAELAGLPGDTEVSLYYSDEFDPDNRDCYGIEIDTFVGDR